MHSQFRKFYFSFIASALISWVVLACVVGTTKPEHNNLSILFFYVFLFLAIVSTCSTLELFLRSKFAPAEFKNMTQSSMRQSVLVALLLISLLALQAQNLLFWWVGLSLLLLFISIEVFSNL